MISQMSKGLTAALRRGGAGRARSLRRSRLAWARHRARSGGDGDPADACVRKYRDAVRTSVLGRPARRRGYTPRAMIDFIPPSILVTIGPFPIHFYGLAYAVGLAATYWVMSHEARRRGYGTDLLANGLIVVAIAAIIGGRAYHVIDQFAYYKDHLAQAFLPVDAAGNFIGFGGLGVYGGIVTGTIAAFIYLRRKHQSFWLWADIVAPGLFAMQAVARWGNFFNQELYGPPTNLPWGIAIECSHRIAQYACPAGSDPNATLGEHFQPLFLYESLSGLLGVLGAHVPRPAVRPAPADRRPARRVLHLVRDRALRPRDPAGRQLDLLRGPDGPDLLDDLHRARDRHPRDPASPWRADVPGRGLGREGRGPGAGRGSRRGRHGRRRRDGPGRRRRGGGGRVGGARWHGGARTSPTRAMGATTT